MSDVVKMKLFKELSKSKKGQLFVIESFIAVTVMIIMVTAMYEVQVATNTPIEEKYSNVAYNLLESMDKSGTLDNFVQVLKNGTLSQQISVKENIISIVLASIPDNGNFYFYCKNITSNEIVQNSVINSLVDKPTAISTAEYLVLEINGNYEPYLFYLSIWLEGIN